MLKQVLKNSILLLGFFVFGISGLFAQAVPQGFKYQTTVRDNTGIPVVNATVKIRFSFYSGSATGTLQWQEDQLLVTNDYGHVTTVIGTGASTGAGAQTFFNQLDWGSSAYFLKVSLDPAGGTSFTDMGTSQLFSVPYAFHAQTTAGVSAYNLSDFADVNLSGLAAGKLLKWNGAYWAALPDNDSDTVSFAYNAEHSASSDTAGYVYAANASDTVLFAYHTGSAGHSPVSGTAQSTPDAGHSDTALYAFASGPVAWKRNGNAVTAGFLFKYIGTNDSTDVVFRTNNASRVTVNANGNMLIANPANAASLSVPGIDGLLATGTFHSGALRHTGAGTRMIWFPAKGSFRAGGVDGSLFDSASIGHYSMAAGFNVRARDYSVSFGNTCVTGDYDVAIGRKCQATAVGAYPNGSGVALGDSSLATSQRCVAIGRGNFTSGATSVAIGFFNKATIGVSTALGTGCNANGSYSTAMGYYASSNAKIGSFVYADASSVTPTGSNVNFQFKVRASGGIIFYTDPAQTMGVSLAAGSGSWSSVSDRNKKENFKPVDVEQVLKSIEQMKITSWNYISEEDHIRHIGPMAQDFYKAFRFGESSVMITSLDMDGVIMAGVKGVNNRIVKELASLEQVTEIQKRVNDLKMDDVNKRLDAIEAALTK